MRTVICGPGSIYTERSDLSADPADGAVAPAFSEDVDVKAWRALDGKRFRRLTIELEEE